jgi:hypothetical protein
LAAPVGFFAVASHTTLVAMSLAQAVSSNASLPGWPRLTDDISLPARLPASRRGLRALPTPPATTFRWGEDTHELKYDGGG